MAPRGRFRQSVYTPASPPSARAIPATQQCTQMPQNGVESPFSPICVHSCVPTVRSRDPASQQCTQMPQNGVESPFSPICVHSCVPTVRSRDPAAQQCTQMPRNGAERPFPPICVHSCVPTVRSRDPRDATVYTNAPERRREPIFANLCTLPRPHRPLAQPGGATGSTTSTAPWPRDAKTLGPDAHACRRGGDATSYPHELTKSLT